LASCWHAALQVTCQVRGMCLACPYAVVRLQREVVTSYVLPDVFHGCCFVPAMLGTQLSVQPDSYSGPNYTGGCTQMLDDMVQCCFLHW
jgi:hypothetical protein